MIHVHDRSQTLQVFQNFLPGATETVHFDEAIDLIVNNVHNYHHFIVEFLPRCCVHCAATR